LSRPSGGKSEEVSHEASQDYKLLMNQKIATSGCTSSLKCLKIMPGHCPLLAVSIGQQEMWMEDSRIPLFTAS